MHLTPQQRSYFDTFGFLIFPGLVADCIDEITTAFENVWRERGGGHNGKPHSGERRSLIVPFIDQHERLCALLDDVRISGIVESLLGPDFNYWTSDGNYYTGDTKWHSHPFFGNLRAVKLAFYLDPLKAETGCLRVIPGSHKFGDTYANELHAFLKDSEELWSLSPSQVPSVALETQPGDVIVFNHCIKHGSFGGGKQRRLFVINCCERFPDEKLDVLQTMVGSMARFWVDSVYGKAMVETADAKRMKHLEQILANQNHLPALAAKAKLEMSEPSRG
jgi:hypothetical protein